jgi:hypothetical protein
MWGLAKMGSLEREQMFPLEEEVNNTQDYNSWYAQKKVVDTRERVHRCKAHKTNVGPYGKGLVLLASNKSKGEYLKDTQRHSIECARVMAISITEYLKDQNLGFQQLAMDKFLCHPLVKDFLPPYLENIANLKRRYDIVGNLKEAIAFHFIGAHQSNLIISKDIVCTLVASSQPMKSISGKGIAKMLSVDKRNMKRRLER